jgi:hypothetical protein
VVVGKMMGISVELRGQLIGATNHADRWNWSVHPIYLDQLYPGKQSADWRFLRGLSCAEDLHLQPKRVEEGERELAQRGFFLILCCQSVVDSLASCWLDIHVVIHQHAIRLRVLPTPANSMS